MPEYKTEHYHFHYREGTKAARDVKLIAACQEACFQYICGVLHTEPNFALRYYLCESAEEVGRLYGDGEPCNGFARYPDQVYAVYNEETRCIGFHEDVHLISETIGHPDAPAVREGLAMCFDRVWWGIHNMEWVGFFLRSGRYQPVEKLLDNDFFFSQPCSVTYPIIGAFTEWLILTYGIESYLRMYRMQDTESAFKSVYHSSVSDLDRRFTDYLSLIRTDSKLEKRMQELLTEERK